MALSGHTQFKKVKDDSNQGYHYSCATCGADYHSKTSANAHSRYFENERKSHEKYTGRHVE